MNATQSVSKTLLEIGAVKLRPDDPFTWSSGLKSPVYCDNRLLLSYPQKRDEVKIALIDKSKELGSFNLVAGVATAGIAHGALLADALNLPFVYVRSKPKGHGRENLIEGRLEKGARVLVVEDLISTGKSSLAAVGELEKKDCEVSGVLAIFSYGFEVARENFGAAGCPYASLTDFDTLIEIAREMDYISGDQLTLLADWNKAPRKWSKLHQNI